MNETDTTRRLVIDHFRALYDGAVGSNRVMEAKLFGLAALNVALAALVITQDASPAVIVISVVALAAGLFHLMNGSGPTYHLVPGGGGWDEIWRNYLDTAPALSQVLSDLLAAIDAAKTVNRRKSRALDGAVRALIFQLSALVVLVVELVARSL